MKTTTENIIFDGYCPACKLQEETVDMLINDMDFYECKRCHLQMTVFPEAAVILRWKGEEKFRSTETLASQGFTGQLIYAAETQSGKEIFPDQDEPLTNNFDLEAYITGIHETEEAFLKVRFDNRSPILKQQETYLETIADEEWENLLLLYEQVEKDGLGSDAFQQFHQMLYGLKMVFDFPWIQWKGRKRVENAATDYSMATLLELSCCLTVIFRIDRFDEVSIKQAFDNGTLRKIMQRLEELT